MTVTVRTASGRPASVDSLRSTVKSVRPDVVVTRTRTFADHVNGLLARERALALLSGWFGVLALVLACVGLYGVISHDVTRRRQELGIRLALGAEPAALQGAVLRDAAIVVMAGLAIGVAAALMLSKLMAGLLFDVSARDPLTLGAAAAVLGLTTLLAAYLPARRASRVDPTMVLRSSSADRQTGDCRRACVYSRTGLSGRNDDTGIAGTVREQPSLGGEVHQDPPGLLRHAEGAAGAAVPVDRLRRQPRACERRSSA